jgi:hypothetical protein
LLTVNVVLVSVFVIVQLAGTALAIGTLPQFVVMMYPGGTAVSPALQVAPALKPITVATKGVPGAELPEPGETAPLEQVMLTGTGVMSPAGE